MRSIDADGPFATVSVPKGVFLQLTIRSATAQEFHLHDYDIESSGTEVTFSLTVDIAGQFVIESHTTGEQVGLLIVE